jgi:hypothetical protein
MEDPVEGRTIGKPYGGVKKNWPAPRSAFATIVEIGPFGFRFNQPWPLQTAK